MSVAQLAAYHRTVPAAATVLRSVHEYGLIHHRAGRGDPEGRSRLTDDIRESLLRFEPRLINVKWCWWTRS
jgi:predicted component of type VI protein secretion system